MRYFGVWLKGLLMGACDVIPGVSGGTIAFITGIYDELLDALHGFNMDTVYLLFKRDIRGVWKAIHGNFLLSLVLGIVVAIATLATLITYLLETYPSFVWAFFTGLILASVVVLWYMIRDKKWQYVLWLLLWWLIGYAITSLPAFSLGGGLWSLFFAGAIAIIAMILPGISGSYLLLILGKYSEVLWYVVDSVDALRTGSLWDIPFVPLAVFIAGIIVWLGIFSRILRWVKEHYHDQMVVVLMWFMLGTLQTIWPRKQTVSTYLDRHGIEKPLIQENVLRPNTEALLWGLWFAGLWVVIILAVYYFTRTKKVSH
jgi:putative membrane protein